MYIENLSNLSNREDWKFPFKGSILYDASLRLYYEYKSKELNARKELSNLIEDKYIMFSDPRMRDLREIIDINGKQAEICSAFVVGFDNQQDREFNLGVSDIVYFGLQYKE